MQFFRILRFRGHLIILIGILYLHGSYGQGKKVLVVEKGEEYVLKEGMLEVDSLIVKGVFRFQDDRNVKLRFSTLVIDGGKFIAGSAEKPYQHQLLFEFVSNSGVIQVLDKGELLLFGKTDDPTKKKKFGCDGFTKEYGSYKMGFSVKKGNFGHMSFSKASKICIDAVGFSGMGTGAKASVLFEDIESNGSYLKNCVFEGSKSTDLEINNSTVVIEGNMIFSKFGTSIKSRFSGLSEPSSIKNNLVHNTSGEHSYAVILENPGHEFIENRVFVGNGTSGVRVLQEKGHTLESERKGQNLIFNTNCITNLSEDVSTTSIGLKIDNLGGKNIVRSNGNTFRNFGIGAVIQNTNFLISNTVFVDNMIGCIPGRSYMENVTFSMENPQSKVASIAVKVTDSHGVSAPKMKKVNIKKYGTGFHFEGLVSPTNYFKEIKYEDTRPTSFSNIHPETLIYDWDGSLLNKKRDVSVQEHHTMHGHHGHHQEMKAEKIPEASGFVIYPEQSFFQHKDDKEVSHMENLRYAPRSRVGTLTIATGMGLTDPVHEHEGRFDGVKLRSETGRDTFFTGKSNKYHLEVIAEQVYDLDFGGAQPSFYDYGFEWEAATGASVYLKLPYPHPNPVAMRSFGNQLYAVEDMETLKLAKESSFFWDQENAMVYLKMIAQTNFEEMVIYSSKVFTEIEFEGEKVPLSIETDKLNHKIHFEYTLPQKNQYSKLEVLDYYGNVVEQLYAGYFEENTNRVSINLESYDFKSNVYRYALTVEGKVHRGPVYKY